MCLIIFKSLIDYILAHVKTIERKLDKIDLFGLPVESKELLGMDPFKMNDQNVW